MYENNNRLKIHRRQYDVLVIGGGTAGCYAALKLAEKSDLKICIAEKAYIKRSGCLAAGVNAINAYITKGRKPSDYVDYAMNDVDGIARYDLLLSISERFNDITHNLEKMGLVILKDENGEYVARGNRNIKINGENIKTILAEAVNSIPNIEVINSLNITDLIHLKDLNSSGSSRVYGAVGFDVNKPECYVIKAPQIIVSTGGASGLYKPNNPGFSRHKMWYSPFNTGAGYAMGINAGAEMTTFEMRFIALRCKDTIAPTGTIAQGVGAKQINAIGEIYETKYGIKTFERIYGTVKENQEGRGPCFLDTTHISEKQEEDLMKAYLNMAPSQTLKWIEDSVGPKDRPVEIEGTEPYVVGGHTASGYWIDDRRRTTVIGLYAAGDVAGGAPQKYVTGALAEGEISAETIIDDRTRLNTDDGIVGIIIDDLLEQQVQQIINGYNDHLNISSYDSQKLIEELENKMQDIMDKYAGGISSGYSYTDSSLEKALQGVIRFQKELDNLPASDMDELLQIYEIKDRLTVSETLIKHLQERKETRWHSFAENASYPDKDEKYKIYINSKNEDGNIRIYHRNIISEQDEKIDFYENGEWKI